MWSIVLREPIKLANGKVLRTLEDVRAFIASIPSDLVRHEKWQDLAALLIDTATSACVECLQLVSDNLKLAIETPPYAPVRLMPEPKPVYIKRRGVGRPRKPVPLGSFDE